MSQGRGFDIKTNFLISFMIILQECFIEDPFFCFFNYKSYLFQLQVIGEGEFGSVYKGKYMTDEGAVRPGEKKLYNKTSPRKKQCGIIRISFSVSFFLIPSSCCQSPQ